jgi:hypothetical protein
MGEKMDFSENDLDCLRKARPTLVESPRNFPGAFAPHKRKGLEKT